MPGLLNPSKSQNLSEQFGFTSLTCPQSLLRFYSRSEPRWHQASLPDEQGLADSQIGLPPRRLETHLALPPWAL